MDVLAVTMCMQEVAHAMLPDVQQCVVLLHVVLSRASKNWYCTAELATSSSNRFVLSSSGLLLHGLCVHWLAWLF